MELDDITGAVVGEAIRIHQRPGPGLLEGVYERLLERRLQRRGLRVESQVGIDFTFDDIDFKDGFRIDLLVEKRVIVEVKSVERGLAPVHTKQLLTYLRLTDLQIGLLLNFDEGGHRARRERSAAISVPGVAREPRGIAPSGPVRRRTVRRGAVPHMSSSPRLWSLSASPRETTRVRAIAAGLANRRLNDASSPSENEERPREATISRGWARAGSGACDDD